MASLDPSLINSDHEDHKWVVEIDEIINRQLDIDVETPPVSLFQVPETVTQQKPEAYEPQQIGLGPIHHFRPLPYKKMEHKKVAVMRKVLKDYDIKDYKLQVLDKVRKFVPTVRSCYDMFLQDDDDSLARVFAIDGLFLLDLFRTYNATIDEYLIYLKRKVYIAKVKAKELNQHIRQEELVVTVDNQIEWEEILGVDHHEPELPEVGPKKRLVAQDVLLVENQIPFMALKEINQTLQGNSSHHLSPSVFRVFCEIHAPLKLCSKSQAPSSVDHLLHYMYYSIVNNVPVQILPDVPHHQIEYVDAMKDVGPAKSDFNHESALNFLSKIPKKEIVQLYEQTISMLETFTQSKHLIPSASILHDKAGFKFHSLEEDKGIQNINVQGEDIYLPMITLNKDSEVILRNLVAYETLTADSDSFPLNEYMGMMCWLIMTNDDVNYLKRQNIITGDMREDQVVELFTAMSKSIPIVTTEETFKLREVIDKINKVYESGIWMKIYLLLKKLACWLLVVLKAIGCFVESSWKIVAFMVSIVSVFVLTYQAYCDSFGCNKKSLT
ncbi:hypothetical protein Hanom_Chr10g00949661 [Helianthus anomalus]